MKCKLLAVPPQPESLLLSFREDMQSLVPVINARYEALQRSFMFRQFITRHDPAPGFLERYPIDSSYYPFDKAEFSLEKYYTGLAANAEKGPGIIYSLKMALPEEFRSEVKIYKDKITQAFKDYYALCVRQNWHPDLDLKWTEDKGWAVYSKQAMWCGTFLGLYPGKIMYLDQYQGDPNNEYLAQVPGSKPEIIMDAQDQGGLTRFLNHSDKPNVRQYWIRVAKLPYMVLVTGHVEAGQELFWNYGGTPPFLKDKK